MSLCATILIIVESGPRQPIGDNTVDEVNSSTRG